MRRLRTLSASSTPRGKAATVLCSATVGAILLTLPALSRAQDATDARIQRALAGLRPAVAVRGERPLRWSLQGRMKELHVPGVSIAVIDGGRVLWAGGFGVLQAGRSDRVATSTLFQAQSISKAIAATTMLALVDAGTLALDTDVNAY